MTQGQGSWGAEALRLRALGLSVIPVHAPGMSLPSSSNGDKDIGKLPLIRWQEYQTRLATEEEIKAWATQWPDANLGVVTGGVSGLIVLDVDGEEGRESLKHLGPTPDTWRSTTGGGEHTYFRRAGGVVRNFAKRLPGLDLRGDGGYVVAPRSLHRSGCRYEWIVAPWETELADPPPWLLGLIDRPQPAKVPTADGERIPQGARNMTLTSLAGTMRGKGMSEEAILAALQVHNKERCNTPLNAEEVQRIASSVARYGQGAPVASKGINHRTDLGNAKRLVARHGRDIRYCFSWGKWLVWDGRRWTEDDTGEVLRRAKQTVASIYGEAGQETDTDARKAKAKHAMASEAEAKIRAMVKMAQSEPEIPLRLADLDADPWLLNVLNGTLDLRNGARNPHRQEDLIMKLAPVEHDPATTCPKWLAFLHLILDGNQDLIHFLQKCVGYALTGDVREQCLFLLYGTGANGKTTFLEVIRALLGNYAKQADFSTFLARPQDRIPNDLARLQGARFVSAVEAESGRRLSEVMVKRATGSDTLTARFLHHEFFEFQAMFKLFLAGNHKPIISGTDHATWRRIRLIPFTVTIPDEKQDKELLAKLKAELPGILAWALQGCRDWQREGLEIPATVAEATKEYQVEMDWLAGFIFDRCVKDPAARTTAEDLFKAYEQYCKDEEEVARSQKIFGTGLKERGFINKKGGGGRWVWHGIRLVTDVTDGDPSSDLSREDSGQDERSREEGHKGHQGSPLDPGRTPKPE